MNRRTKNILIIGSIVVVIAIVLIFLFLIKPTQKNYPKEPITQESVFPSNENIEFKETFKGSDKPIYSVSNATQLENIKTMINILDLDIEKEYEDSGIIYRWEGEGWHFMYDLDQNYLIFKTEKGIDIGEISLNANSLNSFVNRYFQKDWKYEVFETEKRTNGEKVFYAKRYVDQENIIETKIFNKYTDYLALKDGKIIYGKILLTEFKDMNVIAPLIDSDRLNELINIKGYPKEIYPEYSVLQDSVLQEVDYKSYEFIEITETLDNCKSTSVQTVYLYKRFNQTYLTPVYKIDAQCTIEYDKKEYTIPAVVYVNAIDPEYVSVAE